MGVHRLERIYPRVQEEYLRNEATVGNQAVVGEEGGISLNKTISI